MIMLNAERAATYGSSQYSFSLNWESLGRSYQPYLAHDESAGDPSWMTQDYGGVKMWEPTDEYIRVGTATDGARLRIYRGAIPTVPPVVTPTIAAGNRADVTNNPAAKMSVVFFAPIDDCLTTGSYPDTDYTWDTIEVGETVYNDRTEYVWPSIPTGFTGAKFLKTSYDDRTVAAEAFGSWTPGTEWLRLTFKYNQDVWIMLDEDLVDVADNSALVERWVTAAGFALDTTPGAISIAGKAQKFYKKTLTATVEQQFSGNGSPAGEDETELSDNLLVGQSWYFYYTYYRSWDGHEGPPSPISEVFATGSNADNLVKLTATLTGTSLADCDELHLYAQLESVGSAYCLVPDMVVENPGPALTATVEFDFSIEDLMSYGKKLNWLDRFKLPACKYAESFEEAGRLLMWGQDTFIPDDGDTLTMRNYPFYVQYSDQLRLRIEFNPANGKTPTDAELWKTLVFNNKAIGEIFYVTTENSLWNYGGVPVTVAYCVEAYLPQLYGSGVAIADFQVDGSDDVEYDHIAGHHNRIWYTSIIAQSDRDAVGLQVWQGMNPSLFLESEFNGATITGVHVEDSSVYVMTDTPAVWRAVGGFTIGQWAYQRTQLTLNRGIVSPLSLHSVRNSTARGLDMTGVIDIGTSTADNKTDQLGARDLFMETFGNSNLKLAQGVFDQKHEQSIFFPLTHDDSGETNQDRILVDQRNGIVSRENTAHEITDIIAIADDNGFQRLVYSDANGYVGEFKPDAVFTDHIGGSGGYSCWVVSGAIDFGDPSVKKSTAIFVNAAKTNEDGSGAKSITVGLFGSYGDIDPANIDFETYFNDPTLLRTNAQSVNARIETISEANFGNWIPMQVEGTHFILFIAGNSITFPNHVGNISIKLMQD
jgi:hypothetical protein